MTDLLQFKMGDRAPRERGRDDVAASGVRQEILLDVVAIGLEQHAGAAELTNLLLRPLDHAVAFTGLGGHYFASGSHLEALFSARLGLQLGHLALLSPQKNAPEGRFCGLKCSLERWKCSGFSENETTRTDVDTAALNQPGDEGWAYGRGSGNWQ